jgi:hypothetical protein
LLLPLAHEVSRLATRRLDEDKTIALIVHMQAASDDFFFISFTMMEKKRRF